MIECSICNKDLTVQEVKDNIDICNRCNLTIAIETIAKQIKYKYISFPKVIFLIEGEIYK